MNLIFPSSKFLHLKMFVNINHVSIQLILYLIFNVHLHFNFIHLFIKIALVFADPFAYNL